MEQDIEPLYMIIAYSIGLEPMVAYHQQEAASNKRQVYLGTRGPALLSDLSAGTSARFVYYFSGTPTRATKTRVRV